MGTQFNHEVCLYGRSPTQRGKIGFAPKRFAGFGHEYAILILRRRAFGQPPGACFLLGASCHESI